MKMLVLEKRIASTDLCASTTPIQLLDVFGKESNMHLVLEVCEGKDLEKLIHDKRMHFTPGDIKAYLLMTCKGLEFLHSHWILHRDMKSANLLITANGIVKICDFGFATFYGSPSRPLSSQVCVCARARVRCLCVRLVIVVLNMRVPVWD
jgi:serine/threonine protein kinase